MGMTRDLFKKIRDTKGIFHAKMGTVKDRNNMDLTETEDIKKRWQQYTEELYRKIFRLPYLFITKSRSLLKLMSIELTMPSYHLIFCHPLLLLPSIFLSIRVFSNESVLCIRWPKYFGASASPSDMFAYVFSH